MHANATGASPLIKDSGQATAPLVTIALSMQNSDSTIDAALRSLIAQTYSDWELVLHDDGSTDTSVERARQWRDARIRIVVNGVQRGLGARLNQTIDVARGRYFARMDADDIAYPQRLAMQVEYLEAHPAIDLIGAQMMVFADDGRPVGLHAVGESHERICAKPYAGFYLPHPTWMGRIEWFRRWRYDERYRKGQDQELLRRSFGSSRFAGIAHPLVGYRQDRISIRKSWHGRMNMMRSIWALAQRERAPLRGLTGVGTQMTKGLIDTAAVTTGLERLFLRHRARPFSAEEARRWTEVWTACTGEAY
ncbi:MAG: glycosyltransferase family 2 protein [Burkholderiales bacterium]